MPRLQVVRGLPQIALLEPKADALASDVEQLIRQEWEARCGIPGMVDWVVNYHQTTGNAPAADPHNIDPGSWLEVWWRAQLHDQGSGAYEEAKTSRGFRDSAQPLSPQSQAAFRKKWLEEEQQCRLTGKPNLDLHRRLDQQVWGGMDGKARAKTMSHYINTAVQCRPHGFSSVGHVPPDSPLGRLLLHGLHMFLATCFDSSTMTHLHERHCRSVVINHPSHEMMLYNMTYSAGEAPSTFTGAVPPAAVQVPLFDHLSLHWQLLLVSDVLAGLMPPAGRDDSGSCLEPPLPLDHVYNWSAFNKLLLLGMYAPVEEAHAPAGQAQLVRQQLQQLQDARQAEAACALTSLQQALAAFRGVLHEQLQAELAVGQAALQLYAAHQQQHDKQHTHQQMAQLQHQLQDCHLSALLGLSSSTGSAGCSAAEQSQQLVLLVCTLLTWPLVTMSDMVAECAGDDLSPQQQQQHQQQQQQHGGLEQPVCASQLQQLLHAAVAGVGPSDHSSSAAGGQGIRGVLMRALHIGAAADGEQQQGAQPQGDPPQTDPQQVLVCWLLQLLGQQRQHHAGTPEQSQGGAGAAGVAGGGAGGAAAASAAGAGAACSLAQDPVAGVQLQAFTRGLCNLLLLRLLSAAPPCESWSWEACLAVTQLIAASEQAAAAAGDVAFEGLTGVLLEQAAATPGNGCQPTEIALAKLRNYLDCLLQLLQQLQQAQAALLDPDSNSSSTGGRNAGSSRQALPRSRSRSSSRSKRLQQQPLQGSAEPTCWRSLVLNHYRDTRKAGYAWLQEYFEEVEPDNSKPGFWGLVGKFAAADQLNLRHAKVPTVVAAAPSTVLPVHDQEDIAENPGQAQQAILAKQLARMANMQLRQKVIPSNAAPDDGMPVKLSALKSLMQCGCLAAQQPLALLAYTNARPHALQAAAEAAAAQASARPVVDRDGDVFHSPCPSPEPSASDSFQEALDHFDASAAAGASAAAAAEAAEAWLSHTGFHLSSLLALGPLFEESQQGPCLARLLQLLLQHHADTVAAAHSALQRLLPELRKRRLWTPPHSSSGPSATGKSSSSSSSSWRREYLPAERSRLLVLLMGLFHLQMHEEQQRRQQQQQWEREQAARARQWAAARQQGGLSSKGQPARAEQQQQQQQLLRSQAGRQTRAARGAPGGSATGSSSDAAAAAAIGTGSVYGDAQLRQRVAAAAAAAAYDMHDLLLYCLVPLEEFCSPAGATGHGSNSSSSRQQASTQQQQQQRFEVCCVSKALCADGLDLLAQPLQEDDVPPPGAVCDFCCASSAARAAIAAAAWTTQRAPPAEETCQDCGCAFFCSSCRNKAEVLQQHRRCCSAAGAGGALQQAHTDSMNAAYVADTVHYRRAAGALEGHPCNCSTCQALLEVAPTWLHLRSCCNPLVQYTGPWELAQESRQHGSLLPPGLSRPAVGLAVQQGAARRDSKACAFALAQHIATLQKLCLQQLAAAAAARLHAGSDSSQRAQGRRPPAASSSSSAAAGPGSGIPQRGSPAKQDVPAGLGSSLRTRRKQQEQQQQQQQESSWSQGLFKGLQQGLRQGFQGLNMAAAAAGGGFDSPPGSEGLDEEGWWSAFPQLAEQGPQSLEELMQTMGMGEQLPVDELD